jgi:hypothetical protein
VGRSSARSVGRGRDIDVAAVERAHTPGAGERARAVRRESDKRPQAQRWPMAVAEPVRDAHMRTGNQSYVRCGRSALSIDLE